MRISVFGLGYVGTVSLGCLARDGHDVIGVDPNLGKVGLINAGRSPIIEAEIDEIIANGVRESKIVATADPAHAVANSDVSFVCVGTPSRPNGSLDLSFVEAVCKEIGAAIASKSERHTVVMRSTMLPGSMRQLVLPVLEQTSGKKSGVDFGVGYNPEFLREGTAVHDYYSPPKTVIGQIDSASGDVIARIYDGIDAPLIRTDVNTAEMVKYVDNVWHALKVGFANEIGSLSKELKLDGQEIMNIFCRDEKLNLSSYYLRPGFAFGGSCLPKDLRALTYKASRLDVDVPILNSILVSNRRQIGRGVELIRSSGNKKIGVLGFSFKSGTDDLRESPIVELIEQLIGKGFDLRIYDKFVNIAKLVGANRDYILNHIPHIANIMASDVDEVLSHAEVIVIGNSSREFADIVQKLRPDQRVIDLVGIAKPDGDSMSEQYTGIGW